MAPDLPRVGSRTLFLVVPNILAPTVEFQRAELPASGQHDRMTDWPTWIKLMARAQRAATRARALQDETTHIVERSRATRRRRPVTSRSAGSPSGGLHRSSRL